MAELKFDPVMNAFTTYEAVETPKVTYNLPLYGDIDISDWSSGISPLGIPIVASLSKNSTTTQTSLHNTGLFDRNKVHNENDDVTESTAMRDSVPHRKAEGSSNKVIAYNYFLDKGLLPHQAAGIVGNLMVESTLSVSPIAKNPTSGAYGIALWLGGRQKKLFSKYGKNPTLELQLEFLWDELQTDEKQAFNKLLNTRNVEEATNSFMIHFERPSDREMAQSINLRIKYARNLAQK